MTNVIDFIQTSRDRYLDELKDYLAIPSVSALPEHVHSRNADAGKLYVSATIQQARRRGHSAIVVLTPRTVASELRRIPFCRHRASI